MGFIFAVFVPLTRPLQVVCTNFLHTQSTHVDNEYIHVVSFYTLLCPSKISTLDGRKEL